LTVAPYGTWKSPITSDLIVADNVRLGEVRLDGEDTYWTERRPQEGGRTAVVRREPSGYTTDATSPEFNVRDRVHEYGGGAYTVDSGTIFFSNFFDNRVYRQEPAGVATPVTPVGALRYADFIVDRSRGRLICIREDHRVLASEAVNTIVSLNIDGESEGCVLVSGNDFYSTPRLSPDGCRLCWLTWNHPHMPWDGNELWVAEITPGGDLAEARCIAGCAAGPNQAADESIFQPEWSPDGTLAFVSDRTGWWNIYRWHGEEIEAVTNEEAEIGVPQWVFDMTTYGFVGPNRILCVVNRENLEYLASLDLRTSELARIETPYISFSDIRVSADRAVVIGTSPTRPAEVAQLDPASGKLDVLRTSATLPVGPEHFSRAQPIAFPTESGLTAHAFYFPPHNPDFVAPEGELPPLIVASHGGPTAASAAGLELDGVQFWTSRGFGVVDVNYGGSTGYGRAYRLRLNGQWGVVDVDDCVNAARFLVSEGLADPERLIIHGGSAGGYTTLSALAFRDTFKAGCSYFGIADLEVFAHDTHKFESRYLESLVGPFPEQKELYRRRSAINYVDQISCPVILFQGEDDKVVPPNQTRLMVEALNRRGLPNAAIYFAGEGHGFRKAKNITRMFDAELYFYSRVFRFELPDPVEPVQIANL
jgi:dipeptidyl aminopeptidase/acylaminoacyl peptidase